MAESPLRRRMNKQCTGTKAENRTGKRLGARMTPASGALDGAKSDMVLRNFRIENKSTIHVSIRLQLDWLLKIKQEALEHGQSPALTVQFTYENGVPRAGGNWILLPEELFREICEDNIED